MLFSLYRHSKSGAPPLSIGLILDSTKLPGCFAEVIDHILQCNFACLDLIVFTADDVEHPVEPPPERSLRETVSDLLRNRRRRQSILFDVYKRWDRQNLYPFEDPLALTDCSARLQRVESIRVPLVKDGSYFSAPTSAIGRILDKNLDVLISLGSHPLRGEILASAKYGVWSFHHGDSQYYRGGPAYFWEVYDGKTIFGATLEALTAESDTGLILCKGWFAWYPGVSQVRSSNQAYWGATTFVIQKLLDLHQHGWKHLQRTALSPAPYLGRKEMYEAPTNWEMLKWLGPLSVRKTLRRMVRRPTIDHWRMAIRTAAPPLVDSGPSADLSGFQWIESPAGRFYADPFLIEHNSKTWLFFEDGDYSTSRGSISCAEVETNRIGPPIRVLERPYHLSYPCVFHAGGDLYMIPETSANSTVELYRCLSFPDQWELQQVLFRGLAADTTVWIHEDFYWFFTTLLDRRAHAFQFWLFYSTSLTGEWTPHPANPISTDVRNSRGAGAVFQHQGKWFRPSQDCAKHYGYSFTFNEIVRCDRDRYQEKPYRTVNPSWAPGLVGTHTYSRVGHVEVVDGCTPIRKDRLLSSH